MVLFFLTFRTAIRSSDYTALKLLGLHLQFKVNGYKIYGLKIDLEKYESRFRRRRKHTNSRYLPIL